MKITVAPDSLKESLSAPEAARAIVEGVRRGCPEAATVSVPMADGGEGTTVAVVEATGGSYRSAEVAGPRGKPVEATWGMCGDGRTAVVEMAQASGLELLPPDRRNPELTSTYGTGQLILAALEEGARKVIVGIGGSATVDGGTGVAAALGVRFLDADGALVAEPRGGNLPDIHRIDTAGLDPRAREAEFEVASDVTNPLLGPNGAARVYAPQKGATPEQVQRLESGLAALRDAVKRSLGVEAADRPGAGAAGGLGFGLAVFLNARLRSGAQTVMEAVRLSEKMSGSDLVITAEGRADGQSASGKAPACVAAEAHQQGIPVAMLAGSVGQGWEKLLDMGVSALFPIPDRPMEMEEATARAALLLAAASEAALRLWCAARESHDG